MSSYLDKWRKVNLGKSKTIKQREKDEMELEFHEYLNTSLTSSELYYTEPDEVPNKETNKKSLMSMFDVAKNDKTNLDEKWLLCDKDLNIDVGSYVYDDKGNYWLIVFEEFKSVDVHKKFNVRRCNLIANFKYKGEIYPIPLSILNLTLYAKGIKDSKYMSIADAKRNVLVGANPVTNSIYINNRIMLTKNTTFRVTHVNDFEFTRRDFKPGLLKWMCVQSISTKNDDLENGIAYNDAWNKDSDVEINGDDSIFLGEENEYKINYDGEVEFILDNLPISTKVIDNKNNTCKVIQAIDYDSVGDVIVLLARDKQTQDTIDTKIINVRGI